MGRTAPGGVTREVHRRRAGAWACLIVLGFVAGGTAMAVHDVVAAVGDAEVNVAETVGVSEGTSTLAPAVLTISETITAADAPGSTLGAQLAASEPIVVSDTASVRPAVVVSVVEVVGVADQTPLTLPAFAGANETISVTDVAAFVLSAFAASTESVSVTDTVSITTSNPAPAATTLHPSTVAAGGADLTLGIEGSGFVATSVVHWNGSPRGTTFVSPTRLDAAIPASDLAIAGPLAVVSITVVTPAPGGGTSGALPFVIAGAQVSSSDSAVAEPGETESAAILPTTPGAAGVSATLTNAGGAAAIVTAATYASNPTGAPLFDVGGAYVDLHVSGADAGDTVAARFYYPSTTTGAAESALELRYFDGTAWAPVLGSGGVTPAKDTTDDLDGTISGGRFAVTFSATSTPAVTELGGTVIAVLVIDTTPPSIVSTVTPDSNPAGWHAGDVTVSWSITDPESGVASSTDCDTRTLVDETAGADVTCSATNGAGLTASTTLTFRIDRTAPVLEAPAQTIGTSTGCSYTGAIGSASARDNLTPESELTITNDAPSEFPFGDTIVSWTAADAAGNSASVTQLVSVVDDDAPSITAPADLSVLAASGAGTVITAAELGSPAAADNCGSVSTSVSGVPAGDLFPIGVTTLTWTATDASGNASTATQMVTVSYSVCMLYDPTKVKQLGSVVPIKLQLCSESGANLSSAALTVHATGLTKTSDSTSGPVESAGNANADSDFRYDATLGGTGGYVFNLKTTDLSMGSWLLEFTVAGQSYSVPLQLK